jgi:hypothetical protein
LLQELRKKEILGRGPLLFAELFGLSVAELYQKSGGKMCHNAQVVLIAWREKILGSFFKSLDGTNHTLTVRQRRAGAIDWIRWPLSRSIWL